MAFEESKHPRSKDGKFAPKGSGTATGGAKGTIHKGKPTETKATLTDEYRTRTSPTGDKKQRKVTYGEDIYGKPIEEFIDIDDIDEEIEIDNDYERAYGPAPDREEFPDEYNKYIKRYNTWLKSNDGVGGVKYSEEEADDLDDITYSGHVVSSAEDELGIDVLDSKESYDKVKKWILNNKYALTQSEAEQLIKNSLSQKGLEKLNKILDDDERKQAYKLFDLPF